MIPLRLELRNFMSYGENVPPLDLTGLRTICLSGDNGNGKSALLDAITWSLWGESRAGKNKHDELVRIGADEMSVIFTFEMDSQIYRVLRKRSKRASGNQWELQQQESAGWRSLTGNHAGETERAIQKLLRMSYDTFSNSAYLRQGQADQFVRQPPGKRKEILGEILDLSRYDQLEARAREKARAAGAEATDLERDLNSYQAELARAPGYRQAAESLQEQVGLLQAKRDLLRVEWDGARDQRNRLETQKQQAESLSQQSITLEEEIRELQAERADAQAEAERAQVLLTRKEQILRDYALLQQTRERLEDLSKDLERVHQTRQRLAAAEKEWLIAENEVQREVERARLEETQAAGRLKDYPTLQRDHEMLSHKVSQAEALLQQQTAERERLDHATEQFSMLRQENALVEQTIRQWQERIALLNQQRAVCEVCNSPLPPDKVAAARHDYEAGLAEAQTAAKTVRQEAALYKKEMTQLQESINSLEAQLHSATDDKVRLGQVSQRLLELKTIQADYPTFAAARERAEKKLAEKKFAPEAQAKMENLQQVLRSLGHVETEHAAAREQAAQLAEAERLHLALEHAQGALTLAEGRRARAQRFLGLREENLTSVKAQRQALAGVEEGLALAEQRLQEIRSAEAQRADQERALTEQLIRQQQALDHCAQIEILSAETQQKLNCAKKDEEAYKQLTQAFGKKGVQALIIENAIPELQEEANRLLERLTDGDMSLFFDTLREGKSKKTGPIETLDIKVSDNLGTRPLEMYSGGEGFRAAFALRIALSKLLAHRAGARLQTLIIDEGFGTQDGKGREKLVEAVNAIQEDFEKIIVITHIDELKDAFAARIEVTKTPSGSQFTLLEGAAG